MYFYVPDYLSQDFDDSLSINSKLCYVNGSTTPISVNVNIGDLKSNVRNIGDGTFIIEYSKNVATPLRKGDLLNIEDSDYLVVWKPIADINCLNSKIQLCTQNITFERYLDIVFDSSGNSTTPAGYITIADNVKSFEFRNGMTVFNANESDVGIVPSQRIGVSMQCNEYTYQLKITDEFSIRNNRYIITDIDYSQLNVLDNTGVLNIFAQILVTHRRE